MLKTYPLPPGLKTLSKTALPRYKPEKIILFLIKSFDFELTSLIEY